MTAIATLPVVLGVGIHSARPAASAVGKGGLYSCTTHGLVYQTDGSSWSTWATLSGQSQTAICCFVYNSGTQSLNAATLTYITYDSELIDTNAFHDTGSNTSRLVAPFTGKYRMSAGLWYGTTSGTNYVLFDKNHAGAYIRGGATAQNSGGSGMFLSTAPIQLTAGDYLEVVGYHTQSGSIAVGDSGSTPSQQNWAAMEFLGV